MNDQARRLLLEQLEVQAVNIRSRREYCDNEEQTKVSLINPYLECLGFDVRDPREVKFELTADVGKKNEKVDYAIMDKDGNPVILIEVKPQDVKIGRDSPPPSQLWRYALALDSVQHVAYTNGVDWNWYTKKLGSANLEETPFLVHSAVEPTMRETDWLVSLKLDPTRHSEIVQEEQIRTRILNWFLKEISHQGPTDGFVAHVGREIREGSKVTGREAAAIKRLWPKVIRAYIDNEIQLRIKRIEMRSDTDDISEESKERSEDQNTGLIETESREFETASGKVVLHSGTTARAWRHRRSTHWSACKNMSEVCLQVIREIALMDDRAENEFYHILSEKLNYIRESSANFARPKSWHKLNQNWSFNTNANNEDKLNWVKGVASLCRVNNQSIDFEKEFEIWSPQRKIKN